MNARARPDYATEASAPGSDSGVRSAVQRRQWEAGQRRRWTKRGAAAAASDGPAAAVGQQQRQGATPPAASREHPHWRWAGQHAPGPWNSATLAAHFTPARACSHGSAPRRMWTPSLLDGATHLGAKDRRSQLHAVTLSSPRPPAQPVVRRPLEVAFTTRFFFCRQPEF